MMHSHEPELRKFVAPEVVFGVGSEHQWAILPKDSLFLPP